MFAEAFKGHGGLYLVSRKMSAQFLQVFIFLIHCILVVVLKERLLQYLIEGLREDIIMNDLSILILFKDNFLSIVLIDDNILDFDHPVSIFSQQLDIS